MNRRNFLKGFTAATGALAIAPGLAISSVENITEIPTWSGLYPTLQEFAMANPCAFHDFVITYGNGFNAIDWLMKYPAH